MVEPEVWESGIVDVSFGENVTIVKPVNLYGCTIGDGTFIGPFVEIQRDVTIGRDCRIQSHAFICELVTIGDECFISHGALPRNSIRGWANTYCRSRPDRPASPPCTMLRPPRPGGVTIAPRSSARLRADRAKPAASTAGDAPNPADHRRANMLSPRKEPKPRQLQALACHLRNRCMRGRTLLT